MSILLPLISSRRGQDLRQAPPPLLLRPTRGRGEEGTSSSVLAKANEGSKAPMVLEETHEALEWGKSSRRRRRAGTPKEKGASAQMRRFLLALAPSGRLGFTSRPLWPLGQPESFGNK